ncbi:MAG: ATP-binding protein [Acutalibacteraceae bacterium]|jgi:signal transduction histidine kinase
MKLWHKVFLASLALILLAVNVTAGVILVSSHRLTLQREQEQAVSQYRYLAATLQNRVVYERLRRGRPILPDAEVDALLSTLVASRVGGDSGVAIAHDQGAMLTKWQADPLAEAFVTTVRESTADSDTVRITVIEQDECRYVLVGGPVTLEATRHFLFTVTDVTAVYDTLSGQLRFVRLISVAFASVIGGILMLIVWRLLSPLHRIHETMQAIAEGDYRRRVPEKGGREFRELAKNINQMAASIEDNVSRLEGLAESRKQFIDNLAHEMKTPLTSILGFADILRITRAVSDERRRQYAGIIVEETKRLQALSGKLMELVTTRNVTLDRETLSAADLLADTADKMVPLLSKRGVALRWEAQDGVTLTVDRTLFASLLYNLIDNAAKASAEGQTVTLTCRRSADGRIRLAVIDRGIGMPQSEIDKVTAPFYMVDKSRSRKAGGAGLGLALCAEIVRRHQGELRIDSAPDEGTTAAVYLPQEEAL